MSNSRSPAQERDPLLAGFVAISSALGFSVFSDDLEHMDEMGEKIQPTGPGHPSVSGSKTLGRKITCGLRKRGVGGNELHTSERGAKGAPYLERVMSRANEKNLTRSAKAPYQNSRELLGCLFPESSKNVSKNLVESIPH